MISLPSRAPVEPGSLTSCGLQVEPAPEAAATGTRKPENARLRRPLPIEEARTYKSVMTQIHGAPRYFPIRDLTHGGDVDALMFFYDLDANQRALQSREGAVPIDIFTSGGDAFLGALQRFLGAFEVDVLGAFGELG